MRHHTFAVLPVLAVVAAAGPRPALAAEPPAARSTYHRLDKNNAAVLRVDHQSGLMTNDDAVQATPKPTPKPNP
jgi:hypothetical protein